MNLVSFSQSFLLFNGSTKQRSILLIVKRSNNRWSFPIVLHMDVSLINVWQRNVRYETSISSDAILCLIQNYETDNSNSESTEIYWEIWISNWIANVFIGRIKNRIWCLVRSLLMCSIDQQSRDPFSSILIRVRIEWWSWDTSPLMDFHVDTWKLTDKFSDEETWMSRFFRDCFGPQIMKRTSFTSHDDYHDITSFANISNVEIKWKWKILTKGNWNHVIWDIFDEKLTVIFHLFQRSLSVCNIFVVVRIIISYIDLTCVKLVIISNIWWFRQISYGYWMYIFSSDIIPFPQQRNNMERLDFFF